MGTIRIIWTPVAVMVILLAGTARAGPVTTFTDLDAFLEAAGDVQEIDFETLPDGSPSFSGAEIIPAFNYTDQGAEFFSHIPELIITGNDISGFKLCACGPKDPGTRNWLIAEFMVPVTAVGVVFPGSATLSLIDESGGVIATQFFETIASFRFGGFTSDIPIARLVVDDANNTASAGTLLFVPVPEPGTLILLGLGSLGLARRRRRAARCP